MQKPPLDDLPRQKLKEIFTTHGRSICDTPLLCKSLLLDYCYSEHKREINILIVAIEEHAVDDLLKTRSHEPFELLRVRLVNRLCVNRGLADDAAQWAIDAWVFALDINTGEENRSDTSAKNTTSTTNTTTSTPNSTAEKPPTQISSVSSWQVIGEAQPAPTHAQSRDTFLWREQPATYLSLVLADGLNGVVNFRSQVGARLAAESVMQEIEEFVSALSTFQALTDPFKAQPLVGQLLPRILNRWYAAIEGHWQQTPLTQEEVQWLARNENVGFAEMIRINHVFPYDVGLMATLITEGIVLYLQLGGGNIITISQVGEVTRPLESSLGGGTLGASHALQYFRSHLQARSSLRTDLILLVTASYVKSFPKKDGIVHNSTELWRLMRYADSDRLGTRMHEQVMQFTTIQNDDVTVGMACNVQAFKNKSHHAIEPSLAKTTAMLQATLVVSQDGWGDTSTISEAVRRATPGTRILVHPGFYRENPLFLDKNIEISGDGPRDTIVIESKVPCIIVQTPQVTLSSVTIRGKLNVGMLGRENAAIVVLQGHLSMFDCDITTDSLMGISVRGVQAEASIYESEIHDSKGGGILFADKARGLLEDCVINNCVYNGVEMTSGSIPVLRRCQIYGSKGSAIRASKNCLGMLEDCTIFANAYTAVMIYQGGNPTLQRCQISSNKVNGILVDADGRGTFLDCQIYGNAGSGIEIGHGSNPLIQSCKIYRNGNYGIWINTNGRSIIENCDIFENNYANVHIRQNSHPTLRSSKLHHGRHAGITFQEQSSGLLEHCDISNNAYAGIEIWQGVNNLIRNCTVTHNQYCGIVVGQNSEITVQDCDLRNNTAGAFFIEQGCHINGGGNQE